MLMKLHTRNGYKRVKITDEFDVSPARYSVGDRGYYCATVSRKGLKLGTVEMKPYAPQVEDDGRWTLNGYPAPIKSSSLWVASGHYEHLKLGERGDQ